MKILHLTSGSLKRGAAKGALRLHLGLLENGVESYIATTHSVSNEVVPNLLKMGTIFSQIKYYLNKTFYSKQKFFKKSSTQSLFSDNGTVFEIYSSIDFKQFSIIHLHWVNYSMSVEFINNLSLNSCLVWTLRDMWVFTGGCHYSLTCEAYTRSCGSCPQLDSTNMYDSSFDNAKQKKQLFNSIQFIATSNWLKSVASKSKILANNSIDYIYNSVDIEVFRKLKNSAQLKQKYSLVTDRPILLIGAQNITDSYKGANKICDFINIYQDDYYFVFFGKNSDKLMKSYRNIEGKNFGYVNERKLSELYNLSDAFLMFSTQEAFGKTIVESMCCGTPVVVLAGSAPEELVRYLPKNCGMVWDGINDIQDEITTLINDSSELPVKLIADKFSNSVIAKQYINRYQQLRNDN